MGVPNGAVRRPPAIFLMGPTASGKTDLAVALVERQAGEIISVDSAMVFRDMDIGTAKPEADVLARAPHRLIDILDPSQSYSAARFREDALREMAAITASGKVPILAGGTMLYFSALERGMAPLPEADPAIRAAIEEEAGRIGWDALHGRLARLDPDSARRIHPNDPQRLQRALEVYELTGQPMSSLWAKADAAAFPYRPIKIVLAPADREVLRERIARRFKVMIEKGFLAEVEALWQRGDLTPEFPSIRCVGYRQAWQYLSGELSYELMVENAITATRQFAKRQLTWLRRVEDAVWFDALDERIQEKVLNFLKRNTIT